MDIVRTNSFLKESQIRMFLTDAKKTGKEPDLCGRVQIEGQVYFIASWKNKSRRSGEEFYKGLMHLDGERGRNKGSLTLYKNKFQADGNDRLPMYFGRLSVGNSQMKVSLWEKKRDDKKPFYSGVIRKI